MPACKTSPPPGQDINAYLLRLKDIVAQLNASNDKKRAIERLDLIIADVRDAVRRTNPGVIL
jgi:hypothetical protein